MKQNGGEKKLDGSNPSERETMGSEPERQRRAHERRKQGGSPVTESSKVDKSRDTFKGFVSRRAVLRCSDVVSYSSAHGKDDPYSNSHYHAAAKLLDDPVVRNGRTDFGHGGLRYDKSSCV